RPRVEPLEDRTVPSTVTWTNPSGGDWDTPGNWSGGAVPGAGDDVVISQPGAVTITHAQNAADAVRSASAANPPVLSAGSAALAFGGAQTLGAAPGGTVTLAGGSVQVPAGSALTVAAGVTVHGAGTVGSGGAVTNNGTLAADAGGRLAVRGATNYSAGTLTG